MHPWTTPPTSWPTPPQPANPSSTWPPQPTSMASTPRPPMTWPTTAPPPTSPPQPAFTIEPQQFLINTPHSSGTTPTPVEHLFGQPSALHPTWPSSTSPQQTASTMPPLSFASLATAPHAVPAPHLVHATTSPLNPDTTSLPTNLPVFATPMAPTFPTTWPTAPPPSNVPTTPPTPLPGSPYPPRVLQSPPSATTTSTIPPAAPQFTAVKAAPKVPSGKKLDKLRRSAAKASSASPPAAPPEPASTPPSSISAEVANLGSTTQQLVESVRLIQAQQQTILDSQRLHEQRQQLLHQDLPPIGSTPPTPSPTLTPPTPIPTTMPPPSAKARPTEPTAPDHTTTSSIPPAPNPRSPTSPSRRPRSRTRRSRSLRSTTHSRRRPPPHRRPDRPRSPLPRHRSSTKHPKDRRTPSPYRRRHRQDDAHHQVLDVIAPTLRLAPELLFGILKAMRLYYDQQHVPRIRLSFPYLMLMTPGASGTIAITQPTTTATLPDPDHLLDHRLLNHHQPHLHMSQHHLEPWPSDYLMATVKTPKLQQHFPSPSSTRTTLKSVNSMRPQQIHTAYDALQNWTPIIQYPFGLYLISPPKFCSTISWMRCSVSWPSHIVPWMTTLCSSKPVKPLSWTSPELSHRHDYLT